MNWWYISIGIIALSSFLSYVIYVIVMSLRVLRIVLEFVLPFCTCAFFFYFFFLSTWFSSEALEFNCQKTCFLTSFFHWSHVWSHLGHSSFLCLGFLICHLLKCFGLSECSKLLIIRKKYQLLLLNICIKYLYLPYFYPASLAEVTTDGFVSAFQSRNDCSWCKIYSACY